MNNAILQRMTKLVFMSAVLVSLTTPASAELPNSELLSSARTAYEAKDFAKVAPLLQPLADQGNAVAQMKLGDFYLEGQGVQKDEQQAFAWHNKAAAQGNPWAEWRVGNAYRDGRAIPKDMAAAVSWWKKAADQGHAYSQHSLGLAYKNGDGVDKDAAQSISWLDKACSTKIGEACSYLAAIYQKGELAPADADKTFSYLSEAAKLDHENAQYRLSMAYNRGTGVPVDKVEALKWATISATHGQPEPAHYRDRLAKELTPAQVEAAQQGAAETQGVIGEAVTAFTQERDASRWGGSVTTITERLPVQLTENQQSPETARPAEPVAPIEPTPSQGDVAVKRQADQPDIAQDRQPKGGNSSQNSADTEQHLPSQVVRPAEPSPAGKSSSSVGAIIVWGLIGYVVYRVVRRKSLKEVKKGKITKFLALNGTYLVIDGKKGNFECGTGRKKFTIAISKMRNGELMNNVDEKRKFNFFGALLGALMGRLAGGAAKHPSLGVAIGTSLGSAGSQEYVSKSVLRLYFNDLEHPIHDLIMINKPTIPGSAKARKVQDLVSRWTNIISIATNIDFDQGISQNSAHDSASQTEYVSDEAASEEDDSFVEYLSEEEIADDVACARLLAAIQKNCAKKTSFSIGSARFDFASKDFKDGLYSHNYYVYINSDAYSANVVYRYSRGQEHLGNIVTCKFDGRSARSKILAAI